VGEVKEKTSGVYKRKKKKGAVQLTRPEKGEGDVGQEETLPGGKNQKRFGDKRSGVKRNGAWCKKERGLGEGGAVEGNGDGSKRKGNWKRKNKEKKKKRGVPKFRGVEVGYSNRVVVGPHAKKKKGLFQKKRRGGSGTVMGGRWGESLPKIERVRKKRAPPVECGGKKGKHEKMGG